MRDLIVLVTNHCLNFFCFQFINLINFINISFIDEQTTKFYVPEALRKSDVCDVCGDECDFCNRNAKPWVSCIKLKIR